MGALARPCRSERGSPLQQLPQVGYRSGDIAGGVAGLHPARRAHTSRVPGGVWVRYAHEMNGYWYPWSHGPVAYRRAWRRVVAPVPRRGRDQRPLRVVGQRRTCSTGAREWWRQLHAYWPGRQWVDAVGSTMIDFGGKKRYTVARFEPRLRELHRRFGLPVMLTEVNVDFGGLPWLRDLRAMLALHAVDQCRRLVAAAEPRQAAPDRDRRPRLGRAPRSRLGGAAPRDHRGRLAPGGRLSGGVARPPGARAGDGATAPVRWTTCRDAARRRRRPT